MAALKSGRESIPCPRFDNWKEDDEIQAHMAVTVKVNLAQERVEKMRLAEIQVPEILAFFKRRLLHIFMLRL